MTYHKTASFIHGSYRGLVLSHRYLVLFDVQDFTKQSQRKYNVGLLTLRWYEKYEHMKGSIYRHRFVNAPSQWETTLQCNVVSHWLCAFTKLTLHLCQLLCTFNMQNAWCRAGERLLWWWMCFYQPHSNPHPIWIIMLIRYQLLPWLPIWYRSNGLSLQPMLSILRGWRSWSKYLPLLLLNLMAVTLIRKFTNNSIK